MQFSIKLRTPNCRVVLHSTGHSQRILSLSDRVIPGPKIDIWQIISSQEKIYFTHVKFCYEWDLIVSVLNIIFTLVNFFFYCWNTKAKQFCVLRTCNFCQNKRVTSYIYVYICIIQDKAACFSLYVDGLGKGMYPSLLYPATIGKIIGTTWFFDLGNITFIEEKLWVKYRISVFWRVYGKLVHHS